MSMYAVLNGINTYNKNTNFAGKGLDLTSAFSAKKYPNNYYGDIVKDLSEGAKLFFEKHKDIDNSVIDFHSFGGLSAIFDLKNNEIIKVSLENPLEFRKHNPIFDIPFLSEVEKYGKTYIVRQPKADTENLTKKQVLGVIQDIYSNGCELSSDGSKYEQYGIYNGKPYLLDTRCAMAMPNLYTMLIDKIYNKINKCYIYLTQKEDEKLLEQRYNKFGYFAYHVDETPRKSLTFKEGIKILYCAIRNNLKYRKNHYQVPYEESKSIYKIGKLIDMQAEGVKG